ncbi:unnamed protein product [Vitrella brassicaformis CCMP3155]|uniref:Protein kinase domain-containing protein n=1 Tax=Vitrella brassicaformis (strain CCMP3155) TaxID=1169540 RepID=A0A0G4EDU3_VITBC|nr:unnamed protein product [Vitrella brassicaformis CCMP3155]|eukprot:CEL93901.1 unnamed protein product [Vitrella brassicaformis CCMP3155]
MSARTQHTRVHSPVPLHRLKYPPLPLHPPAEYRRLQEAAAYEGTKARVGEAAARERVEIMRESGTVEEDWRETRAERDIQGVLHDIHGLEVEGKLTRGGQAEIWKLSGGKAVKVLEENYSRGGRHFQPTYRLYAEKGLASCPNIVRLLESFDVASAGRTCILVEYIEGQGVWELGGCVGEGEARTITKDLLKALAYLHRRHLAHHDVKPENLMRRADGSTVLIDLDLMKEDLTGEGAAEDMMWAGTSAH